MKKVVAIFVEEILNLDFNYLIKLLEAKKFTVYTVALTAKACYQLDKLNIDYETPDMYAYPSISTTDDIKINNDQMRIFMKNFMLTKSTYNYWYSFLEEYIMNNNITVIKYYGSSLKALIDIGKQLGKRFIFV